MFIVCLDKLGTRLYDILMVIRYFPMDSKFKNIQYFYKFHWQVSLLTMFIEYLDTDLSRMQLYGKASPKNEVK